MNDDRRKDPVQRALSLIADRLEAWLDGDGLAFDSLGEALGDSGLTEDELDAALFTLRGLTGSGSGAEVAGLEQAPGRHSHRVLGPEERDTLSPEAWGFLIALRERGSLDPGQLEKVLDRLTASGIRPVGVEIAREVAARVALLGADPGELLEDGAGDGDVAH